MSLLRVTVQKASNLPDVDFRGKSDPFVKVSFQGEPWLARASVAAAVGAGHNARIIERAKALAYPLIQTTDRIFLHDITNSGSVSKLTQTGIERIFKLAAACIASPILEILQEQFCSWKLSSVQ